MFLALLLLFAGAGAAGSMLWRERVGPAAPATSPGTTTAITAPPGASLAGPPRPSGEGSDARAKRIEELETEGKRLLAEVESLRARSPLVEAWFRAELAARYVATVGEPVPDDLLDNEAESLARQARQFMDASVRELAEARKPAPIPTLAAPLVILQVRCGDGGGSPHRIDMLGRVSKFVAERSGTEMTWSDEIDARQSSRAYALGGRVPDGKVFVVARVKWRAIAAGDGNGPGEFSIMMGSEVVANSRENGTYSGSWSGRFEIHAGEESTVQAEASNSSAVEARIEGEFQDERK